MSVRQIGEDFRGYPAQALSVDLFHEQHLSSF
jgi:hypothetical protein